MPIPAIVGVFAGISAAASVASGIAGASQASSQNAQAQSNYEAQKRASEEAARKTNEYNKRVFEADKINYQRQREYEWNTAIKQWQYNSEIQDFQYLQTAKQYLSSVENTQQQLTFRMKDALLFFKQVVLVLKLFNLLLRNKVETQQFLVPV
jgi:hypothetical protein